MGWERVSVSVPVGKDPVPTGKFSVPLGKLRICLEVQENCLWVQTVPLGKFPVPLGKCAICLEVQEICLWVQTIRQWYRVRAGQYVPSFMMVSKLSGRMPNAFCFPRLFGRYLCSLNQLSSCFSGGNGAAASAGQLFITVRTVNAAPHRAYRVAISLMMVICAVDMPGFRGGATGGSWLHGFPFQSTLMVTRLWAGSVAPTGMQTWSSIGQPLVRHLLCALNAFCLPRLLPSERLTTCWRACNCNGRKGMIRRDEGEKKIGNLCLPRRCS